MKNILDSSFHYRPSFATDVRKTFAKVRRQQRDRDQVKATPGAEGKVLKLDQRKKATTP